MRYLLPFYIPLSALVGCGSRDHAGYANTKVIKAPDAILTAMDPVPADWQPHAFLDSVGRLPTAPLVAHATHEADSVFIHQSPLNRVISSADLALLKCTQRTGYLKTRIAQRILSDTGISLRSNEAVMEDSASALGLVRVRYLSFGVDEFGLDVGTSGHAGAAMYFFRGQKLIARHQTTYIYGQSLRHYRDAEGHAVVYYIYSFLRGSGNWWNQYFFYRYEGDKLIPMLTELKNGNLSGFRAAGARNYWLEAAVQQTKPLTLKMVYHVEMPDTASNTSSVINDSTLVEYRWNPATHQLAGQYTASKITRPQVLSYYASSSDLLFINAYYAHLKRALADPAERLATRRYLWAVRQGLSR